MHAEQAIKALRASTSTRRCPPAITIEAMPRLIDAVRDTGLTYMVGEASYYYPGTIYCRDRFAKGDFGHFVYGEAEYLHDMDIGFYEAYQYSGGADWKRTASFPPMLYATHSLSMILSVTNAHLVQVACMGYEDRHDDGVFRTDVSLWGNTFSNATALFRTSDGGMARINEFRRVGYHAYPEVRMSLFGTAANFEVQTNPRSLRGNAAVWNSKSFEETHDLTDLLACGASADDKHLDEDVPEKLRGGFVSDMSAIHPVDRLPAEWAGLPSGHEGSHQFLVLDFIESVLEGKLPPNNVWFAARCCVPGIIAHESARRGGELLKIPDLGEPTR
jgi:predicted dehydrogenase